MPLMIRMIGRIGHDRFSNQIRFAFTRRVRPNNRSIPDACPTAQPTSHPKP